MPQVQGIKVSAWSWRKILYGSTAEEGTNVHSTTPYSVLGRQKLSSKPRTLQVLIECTYPFIELASLSTSSDVRVECVLLHAGFFMCMPMGVIKAAYLSSRAILHLLSKLEAPWRPINTPPRRDRRIQSVILCRHKRAMNGSWKHFGSKGHLFCWPQSLPLSPRTSPCTRPGNPKPIIQNKPGKKWSLLSDCQAGPRRLSTLGEGTAVSKQLPGSGHTVSATTPRLSRGVFMCNTPYASTEYGVRSTSLRASRPRCRTECSIIEVDLSTATKRDRAFAVVKRLSFHMNRLAIWSLEICCAFERTGKGKRLSVSSPDTLLGCSSQHCWTPSNPTRF